MTSNTFFFRKMLTALTGLFLCVFLMVHLSANCILLLPDHNLSSELYNSYSEVLRNNFLIKIVAYLLYLSILVHIVIALIITLKNRQSKPVRYQVNSFKENSSWSSQNMGSLGVLILIFIVVHLINFWARIKLGIGEEVSVDRYGNMDVYGVVMNLFKNGFIVLFYMLMSIPLAFHLHHGFNSAFKSLGFYHKKGLKFIAQVSLFYAGLIGIGFGIIPIIVYFK